MTPRILQTRYSARAVATRRSTIRSTPLKGGAVNRTRKGAAPSSELSRVVRSDVWVGWSCALMNPCRQERPESQQHWDSGPSEAPRQPEGGRSCRPSSRISKACTIHITPMNRKMKPSMSAKGAGGIDQCHDPGCRGEHAEDRPQPSRVAVDGGEDELLGGEHQEHEPGENPHSRSTPAAREAPSTRHGGRASRLLVCAEAVESLRSAWLG